ncbi:hypothetical protein [Dehalobacter sp. CF]|uniref:hypothetical protein n=1 Tax=Dehalobacter sp. CF TaxID=1131462 RepID=UPI00028B8E96|nr:hypothetical protein [Dehalobacter sp. CF]AFV05411.1 hypothetical protein DCF50_p1405 [Dehalobacter sp. CF]
MVNKLVKSGHYNESAYISSDEKEIAYFQLEGYYTAARELINIALEKRNINALIHPIMYCSRHFIEILLKYMIDYINEYSYLKDKHTRGHEIFDDLKILEKYINELLPENPIPIDIRLNIENIVNLDLSSSATRFKYNIIFNKSTKSEEKSFLNAFEINLPLLFEALEDIYSLRYIPVMLQEKWDLLYLYQNNE